MEHGAVVAPGRGWGGEPPGQGRVLEHLNVAGGDVNQRVAVRPAALDQQYPGVRIRAEPVGQDAAGRAGADDDVIRFHVLLLSPSPASRERVADAQRRPGEGLLFIDTLTRLGLPPSAPSPAVRERAKHYDASACRAAPLSIAAPFSAIMIVCALVLLEVTAGITEASMPRKPSSPGTRNSSSTTLIACWPIMQVQLAW